MSSAVTYILNMTGHEFNQVLDPLARATSSELKEQAENGILWEGCLPDTKVEFCADLSGAVTPIWLTINYSAFFGDKNVQLAVKEWEKKVRAITNQTEALRVDEFLLERLESKIGEDWFKETNAFRFAKEWLTANEKEGWAMI